MRDAAELASSSEDYQRLEYSLKLNLRLVNGRFKDMRMYQINSSSVSSAERFMGRTQIETMEMVTPSNLERFQALTKRRGGLNISKDRPKKFTFGTIVENPDDIMQDTEYTFCVFRVGVGRSYCYRRAPTEEIENIPLRDGYDSVYLESSNQDQHHRFQMQYIVYHADNVILTHVIKCRVEIEKLPGALELPACSICGADATLYCENDHDYFCQTCDELAHEGDENEDVYDERAMTMHQLRVRHSRVPIREATPQRFGFCPDHPKRQNEYYDRLRNQAFCALCAIERAQGRKDGQTGLVSLAAAYSSAKKRARNPDAALDQRKEKLRNQMDQISSKIAAIKGQAQTAQDTITKIVEKALKDLSEVVAQKTSVLKADRLELARQYKEIQFMSDYLQAQMEATDPREFLKLSQGHDLLKLQVCQQKTLLSDVEIEISVNQQLQIASDKTIKSLSLEDTQNEK